MVKYKLNIVFAVFCLALSMQTIAMDKKDNGQTEKPNITVNTGDSGTDVNLPSPSNAGQAYALQGKNAPNNQSVKKTKKQKKGKKKKKKVASSQIPRSDAGLPTDKEVNVPSPRHKTQEAEVKEKNEKDDEFASIFKPKSANPDGMEKFNCMVDHTIMKARASYLAKAVDNFTKKMESWKGQKDRVNFNEKIHLHFDRFTVIRKFAVALIEIFKKYGIDHNKFLNDILCPFDDPDSLMEKGQIKFDKKKNTFVFGRAQLTYLMAKVSAILGYDPHGNLKENIKELIQNDLYLEISGPLMTSDYIKEDFFLTTAICNNTEKSNKEVQVSPVDLTSPDWIGIPPLFYAAFYNNTAVINYLLDSCKVDCNVRDSFDRTALMIAAGAGNKDAVQLLLNRKADISAKDYQNKTVLDYVDSALASCAEDESSTYIQIKTMIQNPGATVTKLAANDYVALALAIAAKQKQKEAEKKATNEITLAIEPILMQQDTNANVFLVQSAQLLYQALDYLEKLHAQKEPKELYIQIAQIEATKFATTLLAHLFTRAFEAQQFIDVCLDMQADPQELKAVESNVFKHMLSKKELTALFIKMQKLLKYESLLDLIAHLYKEIRMTISFESILMQCTFHQAMLANNTKMLERLLKCNATLLQPDCFGINPLIYALYRNQKKAIEFMLQQLKGNVKAFSKCDTQGRISSLFASDEYLPLIRKYTDIDYDAASGNSPLMFAITESNIPVVRELLQAGAQVNLQDDLGDVPLNIAYTMLDMHEKESTQYAKAQTVIKLLRTHKADLNKKNEKGHTPLFTATAIGSMDTVESLIKHGADTSIKCNGMTCLARAKQLLDKTKDEKYQTILELLDPMGKVKDAELRAKEEAALVLKELELKKQQEAELQAQKVAELKAKEEEDKRELARKAQRDEEAAAQKTAELKKQQEAELKSKLQAAQKEEKRKAKKAERKAKKEAAAALKELELKKQTELKAKEEQAGKEKEEVERKAKLEKLEKRVAEIYELHKNMSLKTINVPCKDGNGRDTFKQIQMIAYGDTMTDAYKRGEIDLLTWFKQHIQAAHTKKEHNLLWMDLPFEVVNKTSKVPTLEDLVYCPICREHCPGLGSDGNPIEGEYFDLVKQIDELRN